MHPQFNVSTISLSFSYLFILIDVGSYGRESDGGIFSRSGFGRALANNQLNLPPDRKISENSPTLPYVFVGDEAFPLGYHLMRPYPGRNLTEQKTIFNYRLSRARRVVENAFGILSQRFRVFLRRIAVGVDSIDNIIKCACCLHNFLLDDSTATTSREIETDCPLSDLDNIGGNSSVAAQAVRDTFATYFLTDGRVSWQDAFNE